jgi:hypothetical protein
VTSSPTIIISTIEKVSSEAVIVTSFVRLGTSPVILFQPSILMSLHMYLSIFGKPKPERPLIFQPIATVPPLHLIS